MKGHETVVHARDEYAWCDVTTNHIEGYFSQIKRSVDGTHHHVSVEHLHRYLAEFDYRYTTRRMSDSARMEALMDGTDRRLTRAGDPRPAGPGEALRALLAVKPEDEPQPEDENLGSRLTER